MRRSLQVLAVFAALAFGGSSADAALEQGTLELAPALSYTHSSYSAPGAGSASVTQFAGTLGLGYCMSDRAELLGAFILNHISGDFGDATTGGLSGGMGLNFPSSGSNIVPFLQAEVGFLSNSGGGETTLILPSIAAGIRCLIGNSASVNFAAGYQHQTNALGVSDVSANILGLQIGVSIFPGAER